MRYATYDIGGANTKSLVAESKNGLRILNSDIHYFPFWKRKDDFKSFLKGLRIDADAAAVTMTAELCDCFASKREGVEYITSICDSVLEEPFYLTIDGALVRSRDIGDPSALAASNFVASIAYLEDNFDKGILLDMGSTTTDIVPFKRGIRLYAKTDLERLASGQLLYTGLLRTPLCAIASEVPYKSKKIKIASEVFAISADVYNVLGMCDYTCETPDGRGKSTKESMRRVARMLCADLEEIGEDQIRLICAYVRDEQIATISRVLKRTSRGYGLEKAYVCGIGRKIALDACREAGLSSVDLSKKIEAHDNLPCLGLAWMLKEMHE